MTHTALQFAHPPAVRHLGAAWPLAEAWLPPQPPLDGLLLEHWHPLSLCAEPATTSDGARVLVDASLLWRESAAGGLGANGGVEAAASPLGQRALRFAVRELARATLVRSVAQFSLGQLLQDAMPLNGQWGRTLGCGMAVFQARALKAELAGPALSSPVEALAAARFVRALGRSRARVGQRTDTLRRRAQAAAMNTPKLSASSRPGALRPGARPPDAPSVLGWRYSPVAAGLHWAMAALLVFMVGLGWTMASLERDPGAVWLQGLHQTTGLLVWLLLLPRLAWRLLHPPAPLPPTVPLWQRRLGQGTHGLLYVLMALLPLVGLLGAAFSEAGVVALGGGWPRALAFNAARAEWLFELHELLAWALVAAAALHVAGALHHLMVGKDGVFQRMGWQPRG